MKTILVILMALLLWGCALPTEPAVEGTPSTDEVGVMQKTAGAYGDVAVIINMNSPISKEVGNYFVQKRSIPRSNVWKIHVPTSENISSAQFDSMLTQLAPFFLADSQYRIKYIVTTKGMPLKVDCGPVVNPYPTTASVESELTLFASKKNGNNFRKSGRVYSPYYSQNEPFDRGKFDIFLVTRLDGYTVNDVKRLIDRSGIVYIRRDRARVVLDQDPTWNSAAPYLNDYMAQAKTALEGKVSVELNSDTVFVTSRRNVIGYTGWGSNDRHSIMPATPRFTWLPGALAETYVSTSGRSFAYPPVYGQSLIADLIREGVTGVKGYVDEPYSSSMANSAILYDRYLSGYTLAESYYMSSRYLSWMDVIIGDPKTKVQLY